MDDIRVALAQITCPLGKLTDNIEKHQRYAKRAAEEGAKIVCFPELSLSGYPTEDSAVLGVTHPPDGEPARAMQDLSIETGLVILAGYLERGQGEVVYNTQLVASPGGPSGAYRKAHVAGPEARRFRRGDDLPVYSQPAITFGIQICYDNHFPESARTLALRGAEVVFCPYGSPGPFTEEGLAAKRERWLRYLPARAFDNSVYLVVVNQVGSAAAEGSGGVHVSSTARDTHADLPAFPGGSMVLNPWGEVVANARPLVEDLLVVDLLADVLEEKRQDDLQFFTRFRRPDLYRDVLRAP